MAGAARRRWRAISATAPRWPRLLAGAECDALVNLASLGFGHARGIVRAAVRAGLDRAVFVSTTAVTTTLPARSKAVRLAAEDEIRGSGLSWTILRPTMIYGAAGDRNLSRLLALLARLQRGSAPLPLVAAGARRRPSAAAAGPRGRPGRGGADGGGAPGARAGATTWPARSR